MDILVGDVVNAVTKIFDSTKVRSVDTVYEKIDGTSDLRLIISLNKVLFDNVNICYTKLIFTTNESKGIITKTHFTYLFDINCEYVRIDFSTIEDFSEKLNNTFKNNKFGEDIKTISKFSKSPSTLINSWFEENNITDISVTNVDDEKIELMPCTSLFFNFKIDLNNNQSVSLILTKNSDTEYLFKFKIFEEEYDETQKNLKNLVHIIGDNLKNKIKM